MTPQEKILLAVNNLPKEKVERFQKDINVILDYVECVSTNNTFLYREENQLKMERFSNVTCVYLKQGGMTEEEWKRIDRTGPIGEPYWNQLKALLSLRDEINALCEKKKKEA